MTQPGNRRLSAIMFTDMVGFSTLSHQNEKLALAHLSESQQILRGCFMAHQGREVKSTGDGFLVEFANALQAVECAIEIQQSVAERNARLRSNVPIEVRIGIHAGDVVEQDGDIVGDAVNLAARIEPLAGTGGICVTSAVQLQVENKISLPLERLKAKQLKGFALPVDVYRIALEGRKIVHRRQKSGKWILAGVTTAIALGWMWFGRGWPQGGPQAREDGNLQADLGVKSSSMAVLPFTSIGPKRDEDEYLCDGLTEELINSVSNIEGLRVPARASAFSFKGKNTDVREVGKALKVERVLQGTVRREKGKVRVSAQLVNTSDGFIEWSQQYDKEMKDLLRIQGEVAVAIADKLKMRAGPRTKSREVEVKIEAWENLQRGRSVLWSSSAEANHRQAIHFFKKAIDLQPNYADAYAGLSDAYTQLAVGGYERTAEVQALARTLATKALDCDPKGSEASRVNGNVKFNFDWDWDGAKAAYAASMSADPLNALAYTDLAWAEYCTGDLREALRHIEAALRLDPLNNYALEMHFYLLWDNGRRTEAMVLLDKLRSSNPGAPEHHIMLGSCLLADGDPQASVPELKAAVAADPSLRNMMFLGRAYGYSGQKEKALSVLERMQKEMNSSTVIPFFLAAVFESVGQYEIANKWMTRAIASRDPALTQLLLFRESSKNPYYRRWLQTVGLRQPHEP